MKATAQSSIAKISTPRLFGVVQRMRLFAYQDENRGRPLVWIDGPPGAGKTTLIASYLESNQLPVLWYQVDSGDIDAANVFHYLTLASTRVAREDAAALPRLQAEHLSDLTEFSRLFFRRLFANLRPGTVVVFDNYQDVPADGPLDTLVRCAVMEVPPQSSIVCLSREGTPASFAPVIAKGALFQLHWEALQLTVDETREICTAANTRDDWLIHALHQQSEGWAAGVTLMLERLGHQSLPARLLPSDTRESVFDYFAALLFDQSDDRTRAMLLEIAFLPYATQSMAMDLCGKEAAALLESMYRRHLFVDRRPAPQPVYQFHALFRAFLDARARQTMEAVDIARHCARCAEVLVANDDTDAAIDLLLEVGDWNGAVSIATSCAATVVNSGRGQTLERWLSVLPEEATRAQPWLTYWLAIARVRTGSPNGLQTLKQALRRFQEAADIQGEIVCLAALLNTAFVGFSALDAMQEWLNSLLDRMENYGSELSPNVGLKVRGVLCSALFWIEPSHPWTAQAAQRVRMLLAEADDSDVVVAAAGCAIATSSMSGSFEDGDCILDTTLDRAADLRISPPEAIWWFVNAGFMRFFEARYEDALAFMDRASEIADRNGMHASFLIIDLHRCAIECRVPGWRVASASLDAIEARLRNPSPMAKVMLLLLKARRCQWQGRFHEAAELALAADSVTLSIGSRYQTMLFGLLEAEFLAEAGRTDEASTLISRSRALLEHAPALDCWLAALAFMESWLAQATGDRAVALDKLRAALSLAKYGSRKHYFRHFAGAMPVLFAWALEENIEPELVRQIVRTFRLKPKAGAPDTWPWKIGIFTLGRFAVLVDDKALEFSRKVPKKTLALLKALVACGVEGASEQVLCDALWADEEADAAGQALGITVLRLRKLLGVPDAVSQHGGKISLDRSLCWVDAWRLEQLAGSADPHAIPDALRLYAGVFLPDDEGEPWTVACRERLRGKFIHVLATHSANLEDNADVDATMRLYLRGIEADPIVEAFHQGLMRCYQRLGRYTEAISAYRRLRQVLSVVLGVSPSEQSEMLYRAILEACPAASRPTEEHTVIPMPHVERSVRVRGRREKRS